MSDRFQHVMVLTSIIIGLGITNLLLGLSGAIERFTESTRPLRLSWATVFWSAYSFLLMVLFWWWEFRLLDLLKQWSLWNYFLVICYAVVLFLQVDSYMKGGLVYINATGILTWGWNLAGLLIAVVGFRSTRIRTHSTIAILFFVWTLIIGFNVSPLLGLPNR